MKFRQTVKCYNYDTLCNQEGMRVILNVICFFGAITFGLLGWLSVGTSLHITSKSDLFDILLPYICFWLCFFCIGTMVYSWVCIKFEE